MKVKILLILILPCILIGYTGMTNIENEINMTQLSRSGDDWIIHRVEKSEASTIIALHTDKWLMYFLHWRPLTEKNRNLSIDYVKNLLLSFWGPDMPFEIKGEGGKTKVSSHAAYYIDGTIYNNRIQTRFIVWNCEETGRQFISDCNINNSLGTNKKLLNLQFEITSTISCHNNKVLNDNPLLSSKYQSDGFNLSFFKPKHWKTEIFQSKKWFPQGPNDMTGTLWTLVTDSEKFIYLEQQSAQQPLSEVLLRNKVNNLIGSVMPTSSKEMKAVVTSIDLKEIMKKEDQFWGTGKLFTETEYQGEKYNSEYVFKAGLWNRENNIFILCSLASIRNVWGQPFDLTPDAETLDAFVNGEVLPAMNAKVVKSILAEN